MLKKGLAFLTAFVLLFMLCGCSSALNSDELLSPPKPAGEMYEIGLALEKATHSTVKLKYPTSGDYRSAFILKDILNNGFDEYCLAFYAVGKDSTQNIHLNLIKKIENEWVSVSDVYFPASDVEKVDFFDFTNDGKLEIIVGFNVYSGFDKQIAVYSVNNDSLNQRMLESYDYFLINDLDNDKTQELFVLNLDVAKTISTAKTFSFTANGITEEGNCMLDGNVTSYSEPVVSKIANDQPAVFIDAVKGKGMITEVIYFKDGQLFNPYIDNLSGQNIFTQRDMSIAASDINNDGLLDIPTLKQISTVTGNDSSNSYITEWVNFNGAESFAVCHTIMNYVDGYYLTIPSNYLNHLAINRETEQRLRTFYLWDYDANEPVLELFRIKVVTTEDWSKMPASSGFFELKRDNNYVYIGLTPNSSEENGVTKEALKEMFNLIKN